MPFLIPDWLFYAFLISFGFQTLIAFAAVHHVYKNHPLVEFKNPFFWWSWLIQLLLWVCYFIWG